MNAFTSGTLVKTFPTSISADTIGIDNNGRNYRKTNWANVYTIRIRTNIESLARDELSTHKEIEYIEPNNIHIYERSSNNYYEPNDSLFNEQWNMKATGIGVPDTLNESMKASYAWARTQGSTNILVSILEPTGISSQHQDAQNRIINPSELCDGKHGTFVMGIMAANGDNQMGIAGVDWSASIMGGHLGRKTTVSNVVAKIQDAVNSGAKVINCSWQCGFSYTVRNAFNDAYSAGVLVVVANPETGRLLSFPNTVGSNMMNVGALGRTGDPAPYTLEHVFSDISAPGGGTSEGEMLLSLYGQEYPLTPPEPSDPDSEIYEDGPNSRGYIIRPGTPNYAYSFGTSFAAPHVSGVASLLIARRDSLVWGGASIPELSNADLQGIMKVSADPMPGYPETLVGEGRLNAKRALDYLEDLTLTHNSVALQCVCVDVPVYFTSNPFPYQIPEYYLISDGFPWFVVDVYKYHGTYSPVGHYFDSPTYAWLRYEGHEVLWDPIGSNYSGIQISASSTNVTVDTYYYKIKEWWKDGLYVGDPVLFDDLWAPYNPCLVINELSVFSRYSLAEPSPPTIEYARFEQPGGIPEIHLKWTKNAPEEQVTRYELQRAIGDGPFSLLSYELQPAGSPVEYHDQNIKEYQQYWRYKVRAENEADWSDWSDEVTAYWENGGGGGPDSEELLGITEAAPDSLVLNPNYPNPFNPITQIRFGLSEPSHVRLQVLNTRGQQVRTILDEDTPKGWHTVMWDGKDAYGQDAASGIYFYVLDAQGKRLLKKMVLVR